MINNKTFKLLKKYYDLDGIEKDQLVLIAKPSWGSKLWSEVYTKNYAKTLRDRANYLYESGMDLDKYAPDYAGCWQEKFSVGTNEPGNFIQTMDIPKTKTFKKIALGIVIGIGISYVGYKLYKKYQDNKD